MDPYLTGDINKLENIQRRAVRFVKNDYSRQSSVTSMMKDLNWQPLSERRRDQRLTLFFKIVNSLVAIPADFQFNPRPSRNRNSKNIILPACNTDIFKNLFIPRTISDWNSLPENIVTCETLDSFKKAILPAHD